MLQNEKLGLVFIARNQAGKPMYEIELPKAVGNKYASIAPMPRNEQHDVLFPVALKTKVHHESYDRITVTSYIDHPDQVLETFKGINRFDEAVHLAEKIGQPWMFSGGSEVFDPATQRCWSHKTISPIAEPEM